MKDSSVPHKSSLFKPQESWEYIGKMSALIFSTSVQLMDVMQLLGLKMSHYLLSWLICLVLLKAWKLWIKQLFIKRQIFPRYGQVFLIYSPTHPSRIYFLPPFLSFNSLFTCLSFLISSSIARGIQCHVLVWCLIHHFSLLYPNSF